MNKKLSAIIIALSLHTISLIGNLHADINSLQHLAFQKIITDLRNAVLNLNEEIPCNLRDESFNGSLDELLLLRQGYLSDDLVRPLCTYFPIIGEKICAIHLAGTTAPENIDKSDMIHSLIQIRKGRLKGYLVSASHKNAIKILHPVTGECIKALEGHTGAITSVIELIHNEQTYIASASRDNTIRIWDPLTGKCIRIFETEDVFIIIQLKNGNIASAGKVIKIWDISTGQCSNILDDHTDTISSIVQLSNDNFLASASYDGTIKIWDLSTGQCIRSLDDNHDRIKHWALSVIQLNDGNLASTSSDKTIKIWDPFIGKCIRTLKGHKDFVTCVIELRNGNLASGSTDKTVKIWDLSKNNENECLATREWHASTIKALVQLNDGNLVSGSCDRTIKLWYLYSPLEQSLSLKQYLLLEILDNYKNNNEKISLHNQWLNIFQTLPEVYQDEYHEFIYSIEDGNQNDHQVGSKRKLDYDADDELLPPNKK